MIRASAIVAACLLTLDAARGLGAQSTVDWSGTWRGGLVNLPARAGAAAVTVVREVGPPLTANNTCTAWKTSYLERDTVRAVKDYRLCRGASEKDLYFDEGRDVHLASAWLGDVLVTPFKVDKLLLIASVRLRGTTMEEEILTVDDLPAASGIVRLNGRGIQRLTLERVRTP